MGCAAYFIPKSYKTKRRRNAGEAKIQLVRAARLGHHAVRLGHHAVRLGLGHPDQQSARAVPVIAFSAHGRIGGGASERYKKNYLK